MFIFLFVYWMTALRRLFELFNLEGNCFVPTAIGEKKNKHKPNIHLRKRSVYTNTH